MFTYWLILVMRNLHLIMLSSIWNFENSKRESKKWIWPNLFSTQVFQISELKIETKVNRIVDTVRAIFNANANTVLISNKRHCQITFILNSNSQSHRRVFFFLTKFYLQLSRCNTCLSFKNIATKWYWIWMLSAAQDIKNVP